MFFPVNHRRAWLGLKRKNAVLRKYKGRKHPRCRNRPSKGPVAVRNPREHAGQGGWDASDGPGGREVGKTPQDHMDPGKGPHLYLEKHKA